MADNGGVVLLDCLEEHNFVFSQDRKIGEGDNKINGPMSNLKGVDEFTGNYTLPRQLRTYGWSIHC